jgi:amino acid adenylation domain-containing protein
MIILGLAAKLESLQKNEEGVFQDNAAVLIVDGEVVSTIETKKLQKMKKNKSPFSTVLFVLRDYGIKFKDLDKIVLFGTEEYLNNKFKNHYLNRYPGGCSDITGYLHLEFQKEFNVDISVCDLFFINPHFAYAVNIFNMSGYDRCLFLTVNSVNDRCSFMVLKGEKDTVDELDAFTGPVFEKSLEQKVLESLSHHGRNSGFTALCITGNTPVSSSLEENIRSAGIFHDIFSHPIEHAAGFARGAGLYLYHKQAAAQPQPEVKYEVYRNETEKILTQIWQEILAKEKIGINDNFFDRGGNSLTAIVLENEIQKALNVKLSLPEVFKFPTIKELSNRITGLPEKRYAAIAPVEKKEYYIPSSSQLRLYFLQQLDEQGIGYNIPATAILEGDVDENRLENTFRRLLHRHESLRTSFHMTADKPVQRVRDQVEFEIEYYDLQVTGTSDRCKRVFPRSPGPRVKSCIHSFIRQFDLSRAPLFRVGLIKEDEQKYILVVDMHHIISDGVSSGIMIKEFMAIYGGEHLTDIRVQYKDFSGWQNSKEVRESLKQQEEYWLKEFAGDIPVLNLPMDFTRPVTKSFEGSAVNFEIDQKDTMMIKAYAREEGTTLFMVLLAVFNILLSKLSSQEDIIVGTPVAGRHHSDLEHIVGMFVNTLVLRNFPRGDKSFNQFLDEVKNRTLEAFENQDYQYEELVEKATPVRDVGRNPLFDIMLVLQNMDVPRVEIPGLNLKPYPYHQGTSIFDLNFQCIEIEEMLLCTFEYSTKIFKPVTITRFIYYLKKIIPLVIESPGVKILDMEIISEEEKKQVLCDFNNTTADYPKEKTIQQMFEEQVDKTPHYIAAVWGGKQLSYRTLNARANCLASTLRGKGVKPDIIVGIMVKRSIEMLIGMIAILKAGGAYLPVDPGYPEKRIQNMLADSGVRLLLINLDTGNGLAHVVCESEIEVIDLGDNDIYYGYGESHNLTGFNKSSDLVYVIYTSGSTGNPKGVMLEHKNLVNLLNFQYKYTNIDCSKILQFSTLCFDASFHEIFSALLAGGTIYLVNENTRTNLPKLFELVDKNRIKTLFLPISFLKTIFREDDYIKLIPGCITHIQTAGERVVISDNFRKYLRENNVFLHNHYGPSETHVVTTLTIDPRGEIPGLPSIGKPVSNTTIYILDKNAHLLPVGVPGELYIGGVQVGRGYLGKEAFTKEKFLPDPFNASGKLYKSGDLSRWLPDGNIEFLGRIDYQVKIRGFRIELGEIESQLSNHSEIKEAVALVREDDREDKYICAYIVSGRELSISGLREYLSKTLPNYMIPSFFVSIDKIPLTPNGKVDRKALPEPEIKTGVEYIAPRDDIEAKLVRIWSDILGIEKTKISIKTNFFALGGHSLKATIMAARIYKELNVQLPLTEIFKTPTVRGLSGYIKGLTRDKYVSIEPVEQKEYYQLSSAQKRLYVLQQIDEQGTAYNLSSILTLEGHASKNRIEDTFRHLIQRHESLRTSFHMIAEEPVQRVHAWDDVEFEIEYYLAAEERRQRTEDRPGTHVSSVIGHLSSEFIRPFDLSCSPLVRVALIKYLHTPTALRSHPSQQGKKDRYFFMVDMHHIISDGVSISIMIKEFMSIYGGENLTGIKLQYKDFSGWQNSKEVRESLKQQEEYWLKEFEGEIPVLDLPTDFTRPVIQRFEGKTVHFTIGKETTAALKNCALQEGATLYMVLLTVYNIFLSKLTGQEDIVVGTPTTGRRHSSLEHIVGMFVNTLTLRNFPRGAKTVKHFLHELKERTLTAFENQGYQYEELVEQVALKRDTSRNPLFDTMFALQNIDIHEIDIPGLELKPYNHETGMAKFDLTLQCIEIEDRLEFAFEYSTNLFKAVTIQGFINYFKKIIPVVTRNPLEKISDIEIISAEEKKKILFSFNETDMPLPFPPGCTIIELFEAQVGRTPHHTALISGSKRLTYRELNERANRTARQLKRKGVGADRVVGLMVERSIEMIVGIYAILKAGGAYLPVDLDYPGERIRYMLEDSQGKLLLTRFKYTAPTDYNGEVLDVEEAAAQGETGNLRVINTPENLVYIIYTSGSTGKSKGVMIEHRSVINRLHWMQKSYPIDGNDVILQKTTFTFDVSVWELFWWSFYGARLCLLTPGDEKVPVAIIETVAKCRVTTIHFVPSMLNAFLEYLDRDTGITKLKTLRQVFCSGEALKPGQVQEFSSRVMKPLGTKLINLYGPTEATVDVSCFQCPSEGTPGIIPIGKPIDNICLYVTDNDFHLQPVGVTGQLVISGVGVGRGYVNRPELTAEKFVLAPGSLLLALRRTERRKNAIRLRNQPEAFKENPRAKLYLTGDLVRWLPDGNLEFLGRMDHQVKIRGFRIELGEIESQLSHHQEIKEAVATVREDEREDKCICAYIVSGRELSISGLREFLSKTLPNYMIPSFFVYLDKIPLTPNGKVDRKALPEPEIKTGVEYIAPGDDIEAKLVRVWSEILGIEKTKVSINANFFRLGGHSLRATIMAARVHKELNVQLPPAEIFKTPTVRGLAGYIKGLTRGKYLSIEPVEQKEYYHLSSTQRRLYFLQRVDPGNKSYNISYALLLEGEIGKGRVREMYRQLIRRHESFRTSFHMVNEEPVQRIPREVDFEVEYYEAEEGSAQFKKILKSIGCEFDLGQAPLFKVWLIKVGPGKHILVNSFHHVVIDGVSLGTMVDELMAIYKGEQLAPLKVQYKDFADWQHLKPQQDDIKKQEAYWLREFSGELPLLNLHTDYERPEIFSFEGNIVPFKIDTDQIRSLNKLALEEGATLYMVLLTIYTLFLSKITGQEDIIVGTSVTYRQHENLLKVIGMFVNALAMRNYPESGKTFLQFLGEVKKRTLEAFNNQDYQFEDLVHEVIDAPDHSRNPIFDVMFVLNNEDMPQIEIPGLKLTQYEYEEFSAQMDLKLRGIETDSEILFSLEYATKLFKKETIEMYITNFNEVISAVLEEPGLQLKDINISHGLLSTESSILEAEQGDFVF